MFGARNDICKIGTPTVPTGPEPTGTYSYGSNVRCRFYHRSSTREVGDGSQFGVVNTEIMLPPGTSVNEQSRIQLTHRNGRALSGAEYYAVIGFPRDDNPDVFPVVCKLQRISGGSAL
jgi:hypothetical protein